MKKRMKTTGQRQMGPIPVLLLLISVFVSCTQENGVPGEETRTPGGLLSIYFEESVPITRTAGATGLADGTLFKVYAYNQGTDLTTTGPLAEGTYQVGVSSEGKQTITAVTNKDLQLYAGIYDLYFISDNSTSTIPSVTPDASGQPTSQITEVTNGIDCLHVSMKNVGIRSVSSGASTFTVKLDKPFNRLCSALKVGVKAKDGTHPVNPQTLEVVRVTVSGLSANRTFLLGKEAFEVAGGYTGSCLFGTDEKGTTVSIFTNNTTTDAVTLLRSSSAYNVLPCDGSVPLNFEILLRVGYKNSEGTDVSKEFTYEVPVSKVLLAGMLYEFVFTLTFFDDYVPANLQLDIIPYVNTVLDTGHVGG